MVAYMDQSLSHYSKHHRDHVAPPATPSQLATSSSNSSYGTGTANSSYGTGTANNPYAPYSTGGTSTAYGNASNPYGTGSYSSYNTATANSYPGAARRERAQPVPRQRALRQLCGVRDDACHDWRL